MSKCDYEALAATLCLEQTQAIHYYAHTEEGNELGNIAGDVKLSLLLLILFLAYYMLLTVNLVWSLYIHRILLCRLSLC